MEKKNPDWVNKLLEIKKSKEKKDKGDEDEQIKNNL